MDWPPPIKFLVRKDPQAKTSAELLEIAKKLVAEEFAKKGEIPPTFMFDNPLGGHTSAMQVWWNGTAQKRASGMLLRKLLEEISAERYAIITEAWFVSAKVKKDQTAGEAYKAYTDLKLAPSEHPDRKECITVIVWGPETEPLTHVFYIKRRPNSRPVLVDADDWNNLAGGQMIDMTFGKLHQKTH